MAETYCVRHFDQIAKDHCATCNKPYCADCLSMEADQPICANCKEIKTKAATAEVLKAASQSAAGGSPLNFKGKGLDDDPLGLFAASPKPSVPKIEPPAVVPPPPVAVSPPTAAPPSVSPVPVIPSPVPQPKVISPLPSPTVHPGSVSLDKPLIASPLTAAPGPPPNPPVDLSATMKPSPTPGPSLPKASATPSPVVSAAPAPFPADSEALAASLKKMKVFSVAKIWMKYLIRHSYEMFDPLAKKLKVPTYVFLGLIVLLVVGAVIGVGSLLDKPSVILADSIPPIHIIQENSSQVSEMDITAYTDFQAHLQTMGFRPVIQMTVPQLPSPNFFDVGMKEDAGVYSEILKMPGQIAPHLSFVSVFSNGVWFSTNAWQGDNQTMDYLVSAYYPDDSPDQLYAQHVQTLLDKLKQENGWQVQTMGENRYMSALSDHLRWFLNKKDIQGYQADFKLWH